jgi:hypothetical protein
VYGSLPLLDGFNSSGILIRNGLQNMLFERFPFANVLAHQFFRQFWGHALIPNTVRIDHYYRTVLALVVAMGLRDMHVLVQALFLEFMFESQQHVIRAVLSAGRSQAAKNMASDMVGMF